MSLTCGSYLSISLDASPSTSRALNFVWFSPGKRFLCFRSAKRAYSIDEAQNPSRISRGHGRGMTASMPRPGMKSPARKSRTTEEDVLTVGNDDMFVVRVFFLTASPPLERVLSL